MDYEDISAHINFNQLLDPKDRFELHDVIGEGTYGEVFAAKDKQTKKWVAIKVLENIGDNIEEIEEEYLVLRDLCLHPNIPAFHGLYLKRSPHGDDDQLWFVLELCSGGSVTDLVNGLHKISKRLTEEQIAYILRETIDALCYLHANHCMHRDVKGHNILLTNDAFVKLVDFGVSSHLAATMGRRNTSVGTPYWMAPEVIACEQQYDYSYDVRCDVWSVGITAIELADGNPPLAELHPMRALFQIPRNPPPTLLNPKSWSTQFNDFLTRCLVKDFEQRPVIQELMKHPFIAHITGNQDFIRRQLKDVIAELRSRGQLIKRAPEVTTKHGKLKSSRRSRLQPMFFDDLAALENLTEEIVLEQLYQRYSQEQIYTYIGDILLAVNPFRDPGIYTSEQSAKYRNRARSDNPPHIFSVADSAYHSMLHHLQNQCIVISGESGAGKTESANLLLKQFVALGKALNRNLEDKILQVNPIMEAFGNARTGINDNSSRFGKFLELSFKKTGKVTGAKVHVYLLEHSRVVFQTPGESNFHIFTCLYDGLESRKLLKHYHLDVGRKHRHRYLGRHSSGHLDDQDVVRKNCSRFKTVSTGFKLLGFTTEEVDAIFRILAAILNLGDLLFGEKISDSNTEASVIIDQNILSNVADLLAISPVDLNDALTTNSVVTRGEIIQRHNGVTEAVNTRDAMAKALYGRLFDWIVNRINKLLSVDKHAVGEALGIGILDIFGFENFEVNSFEQMCINIANEQLQYYFNQHVFTWEQQEYLSEGIEVDLIEFCDNRPVLDLFLAKPVGLLALLDEESHFPKATDLSLVEKFHNNIKSPYYRRPRSSSLLFTVQHYAGSVSYNAENFLDKNRNFLPLEVIQTLRHSKFEIVRSQFQSPLTKTGNLYSASVKNLSTAKLIYSNPSSLKAGMFGSVCKTKELASQTRAQQTSATYFRYSLMDLLQKMVHGAPHFVRCIKPNGRRSPNEFDRLSVRTQLAYAGVLEAVRIRQQGYSHRLTFADFIKRYHILAFTFDERVSMNRESCCLLLLRLKLDGWAIGKSKVFLKYYHVEYLSRLHDAYFRKVVLVQACIRRWLVKIRLRRQSSMKAQSVLTLQKYTRGWLARKKMSEQQLAGAKRSATPQKSSNAAERSKRTAPPPPLIQVTEAATERQLADLKLMAVLVIQKYYRKQRTRRRFRNLVKAVIEQNAKHRMEISHQLRTDNLEATHFQKSLRPSNIPVRVRPPSSSSSQLSSSRSNVTATPSGQKAVPKKRNAPKAPMDSKTERYYDNLQKPSTNVTRLPSTPNHCGRNNQGKQQAHNKCDIVEMRRQSSKQAAPTPAKRPTVQVPSWNKKRDSEAPLSRPRSDTSHSNTVVTCSNNNSSNMTNSRDGTSFGLRCSSSHDFQHFLRKVGSPPLLSPSFDVISDVKQNSVHLVVSEEDAGPYDFKKLLRKTNYAPTESLRRRKGISEISESSQPLRPVAPPRGRPSIVLSSPHPSTTSIPSPPPRNNNRPSSAEVNGHQKFILTHQFSPQIQIVTQVYDL